jgi:hypothetical protein
MLVEASQVKKRKKEIAIDVKRLTEMGSSVKVSR